MTDPVFGTVRFHKGSWEGQVPFKPTRGLIDVVVPAPSESLSLFHRQFLSDLEQRYPALFPDEIVPLLAREREDPQQESTFSLLGARFPRGPQAGGEWRLWYRSEPAGWFYSVEMSGWTPTRVGDER